MSSLHLFWNKISIFYPDEIHAASGPTVYVWFKSSVEMIPYCFPSPAHQPKFKTYSLAIVKYDSAVGPTVMVHQGQVGEDSHAHSLQASLVTECETIAINLPRRKDESQLTDQTQTWGRTLTSC